ncbi:unnamed protein product [Prorocentrum cordatum]|uniref:Uncharacterized protein n=1 Tax=Prorocentrum cordatum TaxID=2364126 RepID=A0ABN9SNB1_9DINO|nr:unnamed protein product [Polarella glacialis]
MGEGGEPRDLQAPGGEPRAAPPAPHRLARGPMVQRFLSVAGAAIPGLHDLPGSSSSSSSSFSSSSSSSYSSSSSSYSSSSPRAAQEVPPPSRSRGQRRMAPSCGASGSLQRRRQRTVMPTSLFVSLFFLSPHARI